ncbi:MAG: hypothetical protein PHR28_09740 [candidate division Zixibacteria bacterium]|nr:hypothetical protein [candidate division Zixibacteria bacterium]
MAPENTKPQPPKESGRKEKKPRHRSPNYPSMNLGKALEKAKELYDIYKVNSVPEGTAHETWGNSRFGSQGLLCVAALKAFGLIQVDGSGKGRRVVISEQARRILLDADDREELLKQAALLPPLHKELWDYYEGFLPKNDADLRKYLLLEKNFNEQSVDYFIAQFRATIALTKLESGNKLSEDETNGKQKTSLLPGEGPQMGESMVTDPKISQPGKQESPSLTRDYTIPRKEQRLAILRLEYPVTQEDINQIAKWLELMKGTIAED